jgi:O-antigen ligase
MIWRSGIKVALLLTITALCLFEFMLHRQSGFFRKSEAALLSLQWMLLVCIAVWCGSFLFLSFGVKDLPLIGLLLIAVIAYFISNSGDAIILLFAMTLGRGASFALRQNEEGEIQKIVNFLAGVVILLAFSSWWHIKIFGAYHGPRWMGLWNNPNIYGMLMGAGVVLAIGLRARRKNEEGRMQKWRAIILLIATGMMGVGLIFSYSRGAWMGAAIGLLYLAKVYGKFKWRFVLPAVFVVTAVAWFFWSHTPDSAPWYVKRADLGRPSAQHRVAAWKAGFEIMRDHPFGVGWNKAVDVYQKNYSPPEDGAAAITTNDYLMLGTELGLPGLFCFVAYLALCFRRSRPHLTLTLSPPAGSGEGIISSPVTRHLSLQTACRSGALVLLIAFWFDGGLFDLPTASVFWILLELGAVREKQVDGGELIADRPEAL